MLSLPGILASVSRVALSYPQAALAQHASVMRIPGVPLLLLFASVARLSIGMTALAIVLRFSGREADYGYAGSATAAFIGGLAVSGPLYASLLGRVDKPRLLLVLGSTVSSAGILLLSLSWSERGVTTLAVAVLAGVTAPPVSALMRSLWPRVVSPDLQPAVYSLDATLVEVAFIIGPAIVGLASWLAGTHVALGICGAPGLAGVLLLVSHPAIREAAKAPSPTGSIRLWRERSLARAFRQVLVVLFLAAFSFGLVEISVVAVIAGTGNAPLAGLVFAVASVGSVIGGLTLGPAIAAGGHRRLSSVLLALGAVVGTLATMGSPHSVMLTLTAANLLFTPAIGCVYVTVVTGFPGIDRLSAFAWMFSLQLGAIATGNLTAGLIIDRSGAHPAILLAGVCILLAALRAYATGSRGLGSLEGRTPP